jgi:hypothetical protein
VRSAPSRSCFPARLRANVLSFSPRYAERPTCPRSVRLIHAQAAAASDMAFQEPEPGEGQPEDSASDASDSSPSLTRVETKEKYTSRKDCICQLRRVLK